MNRLKDKVALITGATSGIGRAAALLFAQEGACVAVVGRRREAGEAVVREIDAQGGSAIFVEADVTEAENVERAVGITVQSFGRLDVLYNNAGGSSHRDGPVTEAPTDEFWRVIKTDLFGTWLFCKYAIPHLIEAGGGSIVNSASIMAMMGMSRRDAYTAAKGGVVSLTRSMAMEYAPHKVRVNAVVPATVTTERVMKVFEAEPQVRDLVSRTPLGLVEPIDVAYAALYLASDESRSTTGHILAVDAGALSV